MPQKALTGKELVAKINEVKHDRVALIEGFLYENSVLMVAADPGAGKSVLIANVIASLSTGLFAFGNLYVPKPRKCYYIPFERSADEIMERFKHMQTTTLINYDNIFVNDSFIGMNCIDIHDAHKIIDTIKEDCPDPDLIILDPIYAAVAGGLSTDDKASMFCRFSARLQHEFNCSIWMNHHTVKDTYSSFSGEKIGKSDPFYGSQWLKAHCTASYHMKADDSGKASPRTCSRALVSFMFMLPVL